MSDRESVEALARRSADEIEQDVGEYGQPWFSRYRPALLARLVSVFAPALTEREAIKQGEVVLVVAHRAIERLRGKVLDAHSVIQELEGRCRQAEADLAERDALIMDLNHEWAQWFEKWTHTLDREASTLERLSKTEASLRIYQNETLDGLAEYVVRATKAESALAESRVEIERLKADHHKLGSWPECPGCVTMYAQDMEGAKINAELKAKLAAAESVWMDAANGE